MRVAIKRVAHMRRIRAPRAFARGVYAPSHERSVGMPPPRCRGSFSNRCRGAVADHVIMPEWRGALRPALSASWPTGKLLSASLIPILAVILNLGRCLVTPGLFHAVARRRQPQGSLCCLPALGRAG